MTKIQLVNVVAVKIMEKVRNVLRSGVDLDEYRSLDWDDFEVTEDDLIDRGHLLTFAMSYDGDQSERASSLFTRSSDSSLVIVKCAQLASMRKRSVIVSEDFLDTTVEPRKISSVLRKTSVSVTVNMLDITEETNYGVTLMVKMNVMSPLKTMIHLMTYSIKLQKKGH